MKSCEQCGAASHDSADFCGLCMTSFIPDNQPVRQTAPGVPAPDTQPPAEASGLPSSARPSPPPAVQDVSEALRERPVVLRSSMEIFNDAFFFWWENVKFYLLFGLALIAIALLAVGGLMYSAADTISAGVNGTASPQTATSLFYSMARTTAWMSVIILIAYSTLMTATVKIAQGYEVGVFNAIIGGIINLKSLLWLMILQALATAMLLFPVSALLTLTLGSAAAGKMLYFLIGGLVIIAVSAPFIIGMYIFLDQDLKGTKAFAAGIELIGQNWGRVVWRFLVFGLFITFLQIITQFHLFGIGVSLIFAPGMTTIYPWLVYVDLKKVNEARERKSLVPEGLANI